MRKALVKKLALLVEESLEKTTATGTSGIGNAAAFAPTSGSASANRPHSPQVQSHPSGTTQTNSVHHTFNPPSSVSRPVRTSQHKPLLSSDVKAQARTRKHSAYVKLGLTAVTEARKGLSRVLRTDSQQDIDLFGAQLKAADPTAILQDYANNDDDVPCFALSYVQNPPSQGRFKFSKTQWDNFKAALAEVVASGINRIRVWLDQCLWIRDASQGSWAHTGLVPYVLWPVISLGIKNVGDDRTSETYERMWPFVEEVAGLWGMGVIITREMRSKRKEDGSRKWLSYNLRHRCEPELTMCMILLNIFHGAVDHLHTGWKEDVDELKEMALWNVMCEVKGLIVGMDWRSRIASSGQIRASEAVSSLTLPYRNTLLGGVNLFLDGSRFVRTDGTWNGVREWLSGNPTTVPITEADNKLLSIGMDKLNLITDKGEFQLLRVGYHIQALWLLVAMDGRSSNFSRGRVSWTKILSGESSCYLANALKNSNLKFVEKVLEEQVGCNVRILTANNAKSLPIEWV